MEKSKQYFDDIAVEWDSMQTKFFNYEAREMAFKLADIKSGMRAADIGAGTGYMTEGLLDRGLEVTAIDQSEQMLQLLRKKNEGKGFLLAVQGDSDNLPLPDESVDYVFANMFLHHVVSPEKAIGEMYRILRKGGRLVITDLDAHNHEFLVKEQHDIWMGFQREEVESWYLQAGFQSASTHCVGSNCCADSACGCETAAISIFAALGIK